MKHLDFLKKALEKEVTRLEPEIVAWRRYFHRYPEPSFEEHATSRKIQSILKEIGLPFKTCAKPGLVATLKGKPGGRTIGLRADMDALPVQEETGLPFSSTRPGIMHACGHDGHMATVLAVAKILNKFRRDLTGEVRFIFQPAEEQPPGGASAMIKEAVLKGMDRLLGFHFLSDIALNKVWIGKGPVMATTDQFRIVVKGKGGHGSVPHLTVDPIVCSGYLITQLQTIISRKVDPLKSGVISIGKIQAGEAFNIIPDQVEILGTVRTLSDDSRRVIQQEIKRIARGVGASFGCSIQVDYGSYAPSSINHPDFSEEVRQLSTKILLPAQLTEYHPIMGGEDFAFFSRRIPACYLFIGTGKKSGLHHSGKFNLDEKVLPFATRYLACLLCSLQTS